MKIKCEVIEMDDNGTVLECDMPDSGRRARKTRKVTTRNVCVGVKMKEGKNMAKAQSECGKENLSEYQAETDRRNQERGLI